MHLYFHVLGLLLPRTVATVVSQGIESNPYIRSDSKAGGPLIRSSGSRWKNETSAIESVSCREPDPKMRHLSEKNIFQPIDNAAPPFPVVNSHFIEGVGIMPSKSPKQTNKFYTNLFLADQNLPVYTHPYALAWKGCEKKGQCHNGIGIWHTELESVLFGLGDPVSYYSNPNTVHQIVLSARELSNGSMLSIENAKAMSVGMTLSTKESNRTVMKLPLLQGMAFVTARYLRSTPSISTMLGFQNFTLVEQSVLKGIVKYSIVTSDAVQWVMYVVPDDLSRKPRFKLQNDMTYTFGPGKFSGIVQIAKLPKDSPKAEAIYDSAAGVYTIDASLTGSVSGTSGGYRISWKTAGLKNTRSLMFAFPHHVESMQGAQKAKLVDLRLRTTTKGMATGVLGDEMMLIETILPADIGFAPWSAKTETSRTCLQNSTRQEYITGTAKAEINAWPSARLGRENSVYWSGKYVASFARLVQATTLLSDPVMTTAGLQKLTEVVSKWVANRQSYKLVYENGWGGIVNSWGLAPNNGRADYGNAMYNDHHFHYGYWVYSAAVVAALNPAWLKDSRNRAWVNALIRDFANPVEDAHFPFSRNFDWYHGHSWASGLDENADGKNEESTSEDVFAMYAVMLWGQVTGDTAMEARANLQLAILKRSLRNYYLLELDNGNHPANYIDNKVVGILFDNRVDYKTYFGYNTEFIHGIHMLPISPISAYTRSQKFVTEEWLRFFDSIGSPGGFEPKAKDYTAILRGNQALIDPIRSFDFFSAKNFSSGYLMDGESRAYYLMFNALLAGL